MQAHPLPRQQIGEHGLAQQRVPEAVAAVVGDHQQVVVHRLGQRLFEVRRRQAADSSHQLVPDPPARDGRDPQHLLGGRGPLLHPRQQDVGQPEGQGLAVQPGGQQLLGVERVALGAGDDVVHRRLRQPARARGQAPDQRAHLGVRERRQLDPLDAGQADQLGEQGAQRMTAVQVVGAVGGDDGHRLVDQPRQEVAQQVATRPVGPVHVLQHDQQRPGRRELADQSGHRLEQLQPAVVDRLRGRPVRQGAAEIAALAGRHHRRPAAGAAGEQTGEHRIGRGHGRQVGVPGDRAQEVDERQVGQPDVTEVDAVPDQHPDPAGAGSDGELVEQPGLADPGVPREQDGGAAAGRGAVDVRQQPAELVGPADDRGVVPAWHDVDRGTYLRQDRSRGHPGGRGQRARRRLRNQAPRRLWVPFIAAWRTSRR